MYNYRVHAGMNLSFLALQFSPDFKTAGIKCTSEETFPSLCLH